MKKLLVAAFCGITLGICSSHAAELVIKLRPPVSIKERRTPPPSHNHVWIAGYHRWDGHAYGWQPGHWEVRPRPRAVWVPPHYTRRHDGYVFTEGHWR